MLARLAIGVFSVQHLCSEPSRIRHRLSALSVGCRGAAPGRIDFNEKDRFQHKSQAWKPVIHLKCRNYRWFRQRFQQLGFNFGVGVKVLSFSASIFGGSATGLQTFARSKINGAFDPPTEQNGPKVAKEAGIGSWLCLLITRLAMSGKVVLHRTLLFCTVNAC